MSFLKSFVLGFVFLTLIHCGGGMIVKTKYPGQVTTEANELFKRAESLYSRSQWDQAFSLYQQLIQMGEKTALFDEAQYKTGKIHFIKNQFSDAVEAFDYLNQTSPNPAYRAKGALMSGYAAYKAEQNERARESFKKVKVDDLPESLASQYYSLLIRTAGIDINRFELVYAYLKLADIYGKGSYEGGGGDLVSPSEVFNKVDTWVSSPMIVSEIPDWARDYPESFSKPSVNYKIGKTYFEAGDLEKTKKYLASLISAYPKHKYADSARKILEGQGLASPEVKKGGMVIGVLVPSMGPKKSFGDAVLRGVRCGMALEIACAEALKGFLPGGDDFNLVVRDQGVGEEDFKTAYDEMIRLQVLSVIGPLSSQLGPVAAQKAAEGRLPTFVMTQKQDVFSSHGYAFPLGYDTTSQVKDIVHEAFNRRLKNFGIFYPMNTYGKEMADLFEEEVKKNGGTISSRAAYDPNVAANLAGEARQLKVGMTHYSYSGNTNAGTFDALFIPDSYWMIQKILPVLEFVNIRGIPLIGTNAWNDEKLTGESLKSFPGSFYIDLYTSMAAGLNQKFVAGFKNAFGHTPTAIEALGFDAVWMIRKALQDTHDKSGDGLRAAILSQPSWDGVTSIKSFEESAGSKIIPQVISFSTP